MINIEINQTKFMILLGINAISCKIFIGFKIRKYANYECSVKLIYFDDCESII